jgi:hypothetical protein
MTNGKSTKHLRRWAALLLLVAVAALSACGDDEGAAGGEGPATSAPAGADEAGTTTSSPNATGGGPTTGGPTTGGAPGQPSAGANGGTGTGGAGPSTTAAPKPDLPITLDLADDCVRPGGTQTLTVQSKPEIPVGYGVRYADGKTAMEPGYHGGVGGGETDPDGRYKATWAVAPTAPAGPATVTVIANHPDYNRTRRELTFQVANAAGKCP